MNLYRLELMKIRLSVYLWAIFWIFLSLQALAVLFLFLGDAPEEEILFKSWNGLFALSTAVASACFSIFSAVFAARVIVNEYCGKYAVLLFTYPVSRRRILNIKCRLVFGITTVSASICNISVMGILYITAKIFGIVPRLATGHFIVSVLLSSVLSGILSSAIGIISAVFGLKKHSVMSTIICSVIIACFVPNLIAVSLEKIVFSLFIMSVLFALAAGGMYHFLVRGIEIQEV